MGFRVVMTLAEDLPLSDQEIMVDHGDPQRRRMKCLPFAPDSVQSFFPKLKEQMPIIVTDSQLAFVVAQVACAPGRQCSTTVLPPQVVL